MKALKPLGHSFRLANGRVLRVDAPMKSYIAGAISVADSPVPVAVEPPLERENPARARREASVLDVEALRRVLAARNAPSVI
ncbi:MAG: hypothetical protein ABIT38_15580 [Gemmatimonadaceae bacterium]